MNRTLYWLNHRKRTGAPARPDLYIENTIASMMLYQEYAPHPALAAHVDCMWSASVPATGGPHSHRVLPDNCVDILWQDDGQPGFAVGMMRRAIAVRSAGPLRTVAVRFRAGAAGTFLGLPLHALSDQRAGLDQLWGRDAAERLSDALWTDALTDHARIGLIEQQLLRRLATGAGGDGGAPLVRQALAALERSQGALRIEHLAGELGVTRQHIAAQFRSHVGLTPKLYARICRFRQATAALRGAAAPDWAQLALTCGYFDQSHLIHDFQEFAGCAPEGFLLPR
jgi:AraC-like DNA-binding protein